MQSGKKDPLMNNDSVKQLLEITEQHLLGKHSLENAQKYKRRLQELTGKILDEHPEYKKSEEFKKLINATDEYMQKEISLKDDLQYCRKLSKYLCDILGLWRIESISLTKATTLPTKEEMEKLLPSSWPPRWEEVDRYSKDGMAIVSLAHINPDPEDNIGVTILKSGFGGATGMMSLKPEKFDFVGDLSISGYGDKQTAKQFFESYQTIPTQGLSAPTPGASTDIPLGDLIKAFAPKEMVKELESALEKGKKGPAESGVNIERGKYLGEEAKFFVGKDGKKAAQVVLIDNFVIIGILLSTDAFESGNKRIHGIKCKRGSTHSPCSTLKAEGFLHKEEVEQINRSVFSRIKGEKQKSEEASAEIIRGQTKTKNPKEKFEVKKGDTIKTDSKTQVNLADSSGNKISIGGKTEVKINSANNLKLIAGTITAFIKKLRPKTKFEVHTPHSTTGVRGTAFSLFTDGNVTTLTVIEGEVEFSDLKGNKVMAKDNQSCICSKEQGLGKPVSLPIMAELQKPDF